MLDMKIAVSEFRIELDKRLEEMGEEMPLSCEGLLELSRRVDEMILDYIKESESK